MMVQSQHVRKQRWGESVPACCLPSLSLTHLHPVAHLHECTGRVEGTGSTGIQVSAVVVVHNLHVIHAVGLKHKQTRM